MATVTGLFERALGDDWDDLHPAIRERYGLTAGDGRTAVGRGVMDRVDRNPLALPALWLGTLDDFLFPEAGTHVPFTVAAEAFVDDAGREALFLRRRFDTDPPREFVDTLRWNPERGCLADYFGHHGAVVADVHLGVEGDALALRVGDQWLRAGDRFLPLPGLLSARGTLRDRYDDDADEFRVEAEITTPILAPVGPVFGYRGRFENEFRATGDDRVGSSLGGVPLPGTDG
ncbi:DUF4166 domain-containing protein [Candidatus Halobonum tyrrellensis]|uniref:DUF4166 domain-containing protein n=1 Tax=Candidatus Halobonum tyrrellensis G22 TaxID=1324957 RepID=V4GW91_9EURY|nr:DUF4166 domain-containing protein [Candidatus Halobonum tyrrellensis]ESP89421.1 hypothetical protein K933_04296 [Candidatus Halobonum tyrrellensis G22]